MGAQDDENEEGSLPAPPIRTEERYRAFVENSAEGIWCVETEQPISTHLPEEQQIEAFYRFGYLAECNDAFARMYGMSRAEELLGLRLGTLLVRDNPANAAFLSAFIHSGYRLTDAESVEIDLQGNPLYFLNSLTGIIEDGHLVRAWGTQRDITRQKQLEAALRESENRFRTMADSAPVLIWSSGPDASYDWFNKPWLKFTGRAMSEEIGAGWIQNIYPDDQAHCSETYYAAFQARQPLRMEYRLLRHDGVYRWILGRGVPRYTEDGNQFLGYIGSCIDITNRKNAEAETARLLAEKSELVQQQAVLLAQQQAFLKDVLLATTDGVLCLCKDRSSLPLRLHRGSAPADEMILSSSTLALIRAQARQAATLCNLSQEQEFDLVTAVGEAAMNVVVHAPDSSGKGWVLADTEKSIVQVWITDNGPGIPMSRLHRAVLERGFTTAGSLGYGFYMLLKTADRIYLLTDESVGTTIVIEKYRVPIEPEWMQRAGKTF